MLPRGAAAVAPPAAAAGAEVPRQHAGRPSAEADAHALPGLPETGGGGDLRARRQGLPAAAMPRARHDRRPGLFRSAALLSPRRSAASRRPERPGKCCGSPVAGTIRSCIGLVEITRPPAILHCPVCFAGSPSGKHRDVAVGHGRRGGVPCRAGSAGRVAAQRRRTARCIRNCWRSSTSAASCRSNTS